MEEIINYLNKTPENTNPNVLRDMVSSGSSSENSGGNLFLVTMDADSGESDKTFQETYDAFMNGENVVIYDQLNGYYDTVISAMLSEENTTYGFITSNSMYVASSLNNHFSVFQSGDH